VPIRIVLAAKNGIGESPSISYWSGQPGIAGSSHEALDSIADRARFFLTEDFQRARELLQNRPVEWVSSTIGTGSVKIPEACLVREFPRIQRAGFWTASPDKASVSGFVRPKRSGKVVPIRP
jgi:hypothetical protein